MDKIKDIKKSFICAFNGLFFVVNNERNFKIHIVCALYVLYFSQYYNLSKLNYAIILLVIALVMCLEIINTVIEIIINFLSPAYSLFAKKAKDVAASGVLISAFFSVIIGLIYFLDFDIIHLIIRDIFFNWLKLMLFLISIILSTLFIFSKNKKM